VRYEIRACLVYDYGASHIIYARFKPYMIGPLSSRGSDDWRSITHPAVSVTGTSDRDSNTLFLVAKLLPSVATVFPKSRSMLYYSCFLISSRDSA
jgi:hypothetical protein